MIELGSSHKIAALSVRDSIEEIAPGRYQIKVMDFAKEIGASRADFFLKSSWDLALSKPLLTKVINGVIDLFFPITSSRSLLQYLFHDFTRKGIEFIRQANPNIVYTTHFFCATIAAMAKERYGLQYEVINTMTDPFVGHKMLIDNHLNYILAANQIAADYLIRKGMTKEKVKIVPLPIQSKFFKDISDKDSLRKKLNLDKNKLTLLFSAGGQGIGKSEKYIEAIFHQTLPLNIIAVCGNNHNLFRKLSFLKEIPNQKTNLTVLGYVDNMNALLSIADLSVSKAGPYSVFESLACGCPIIFTHWVGYNEKGNLDYCLKQEVGWFTPDCRTFLALLEKILKQKELLDQYRKNIEKLKSTPVLDQISNGSHLTAEFILSRLEASS